MIKLVAVLISFFTICMSILAQDSLDQPQEDVSVLSISRGIAETIDLAQAYLVNGRKKERTLRSDYYEAVGILSLDEGEWSIVAAGLGGRDKTTFGGSDFRGVDVELQASPQRCFRLLASKFGKAFEIKCPLRSLRFSMRSDSSQTMLLIAQLLPRNQTGASSTAGRTATTTFVPRSTSASAEALVETPSITPTDSPTDTPTPTRTPFPTADPESGTYHISRSGGVNVRSCASTSCSVVANYEFGKSLSVTGFENGQTIGGSSRWAKTITGDYIHSSLLTRGSPPATSTPKINLQSLLNSTLDSVVDSVTVTPSSRNVLVKTSLLHGDSETLAEAAIRDIGKSICALKNNGFGSYILTYMGSHESDPEPFSIKFRSRSGTTSSFRCPVRHLSLESLLERLEPILEFSDVSDWLFSMTSLGW